MRKERLTEKIFTILGSSFFGLLAGLFGSYLFWSQPAPYTSKKLVLGLAGMQIIDEETHVFFRVPKDLRNKEKILAEIPMEVANFGQETETNVSVTFTMFDIEGASLSTRSDIGEMFIHSGKLPAQVSRSVSPDENSFHVIYSTSRLLPKTSAMFGEPVLLPKPYPFSETIELTDGSVVTQEGIVEYGFRVPVQSVGQSGVGHATTLVIHSDFTDTEVAVSRKLDEHIESEIEEFASSSGFWQYVFSGLRSQTRRVISIDCNELHSDEVSVFLRCREADGIEFKLFQWSKVF